MARRKKIDAKAVAAKLRGGLNISIEEFCAWADIGRATYFDYRAKGLGPAVTQVVPDGRVTITPEAAQAWAAKHGHAKTFKRAA